MGLSPAGGGGLDREAGVLGSYSRQAAEAKGPALG